MMKKLFSFRSSSNNGNNNSSSVSSADKQQVYWEMPFEDELSEHFSNKHENGGRSSKSSFSKFQKQVHGNSSSSGNSILRRSRSMSSAAFFDDQSRSPASSVSSAAHQHYDHPSRRRSVTPHRRDRPGSHSHYDSSGSSSSSNVSSKVLDLYIDGEQQPERSKAKSNTLQRKFAVNGNSGGRLPPRVQYTAPASPTDGVKNKPRSHSFREAKGTCLNFSSKEWVDNRLGHDSPRRLAKSVVEKLSQTHSSRKSSLREFNFDAPITIEDIYGGPVGRSFNSTLDVPSHDSLDLKSVQANDNVDAELRRRSKEAEERILLLSEELEQESMFQDSNFDVASLIQTIRNLKEDRLSLAIEVSGLLVSRIADRDVLKEEHSLARLELDSQTQKLEKEKNELQLVLEKELDRRSSDWSAKLEKYQIEEQRLRERVREIAEENVSLKREVSCFSEKEQELKHLNSRMEELSKENADIQEHVSELEGKNAVALEDLSCIKRNFKEKDKECKELHKSIARLLRICTEQGKSIEGLQEAFNDKIEKKQPFEKLDKHVMKMQMEAMRLTGVELTLRREVESLRTETDSLRQENIILLSRLKGKGEEIGALTFKLDKEIWTRISYLQNQGLSMLKESTHLCSRLLEISKEGAGQLFDTKLSTESGQRGLDGQFLVEADVKVRGLKRGTENLARSLQTVSSVLQEKSTPDPVKELLCPISGCSLEDALRCELKAETLLTSLLKEKLYSKELEVEQLQAELAAAVRGNEILRSEVQDAMDSLSCASHKLKDFELLMQKKDENVNQLQSDLQESLKELTTVKCILPKISEERDLMWEEVKQYNEKNMVLNSEVNVLKKKIEALDEDILLKEGQITILKDTIGNQKPFSLLDSADYTQEFLLK